MPLAAGSHGDYASVMSSGARKVLDDAYALDASDLAIVSAELSEASDSPAEARREWTQLAIERLERLERGEVEPAQSLDEVEAELRAALSRR